MIDQSTPENDWKFPLLLSCFAGASTCFGAGIVFCFEAKQINRTMSFSLSLAASVMITVSVISIGPECMEGVITFETDSYLNVSIVLLFERLLSFGAGCFGYFLLSKALSAFPEPETFFTQDKKQLKEEDSVLMTLRDKPSSSPSLERRGTTSSPQHRIKTGSMRRLVGSSSPSDGNGDVEWQESSIGLLQENERSSKRRSWRVAMLLFFSLLFHNFPEGLAVVASTVESRELGITVAIGILIHNIPEGIAIAVPCIAAKPDSPWLAFWLASASGLAEPLGAVFALCILKKSKLSLENVLAFVAGIMCTVAGLELYPEACRHTPMRAGNRKNYRSVLSGTICGAAIMILTEWYLT